MKHEQQEEFLDIVDHNDQVIKTLPRSEVYGKGLFGQMRSVWLLIRNSHGQLWIPRRCSTRQVCPDHLEGSVVGHVQAGETYQQALIRETQEEVGFDLTKQSYRHLGKLIPHIHQSFCFADVYECRMDQEPVNWNRQEFSEWSWLTPAELLQRLKQGEKIKDTLPIILREFYGCKI